MSSLVRNRNKNLKRELLQNCGSEYLSELFIYIYIYVRDISER